MLALENTLVEVSNLKCVMECLDDLELKPPDDLSSTDMKNKTLWFKCTEVHKKCLDKKDSSEAGKKKLCSLVWGQCTQMMKNELEATANCAKMSREEDPIASIKNIKGVTCNFRDQRCTTGSLWHAHKQSFSCVQREDEDIEDCCD